MSHLYRCSLSFLFLCFFAGGAFHAPLIAEVASSTPVQANPDPSSDQESSSTFSNSYFKIYADETSYLDLQQVAHDVINNFIIGVPPSEDSDLQNIDEQGRETVVNAATLEERIEAFSTVDNVFAFSTVLGDQFRFKNLKYAGAFFANVDKDVGIAVSAAKKTFQRPRPMNSNGFSYPSGHATRAFVREALLSQIFPECHQALYNQAQQFAQNRVIMGRHYPRDIAAGEIYGKYLAAQLLKNPEFNKEWTRVKEEMRSVFFKPQAITPLFTPIVAPAMAPIMPAIASTQE